MDEYGVGWDVHGGINGVSWVWWRRGLRVYTMVVGLYVLENPVPAPRQPLGCFGLNVIG